MAAVSESMSLVSSFLAVGTPGYGCSPRGPVTPQSSLGWGSALAHQDVANAKPSTALSQSAVPATLTCNKRSCSTLSLGGGDDSDFLDQPLTRFMSEDFMSVFNNPSTNVATNEPNAAMWNTLDEIIEEKSLPGSPTNVEYDVAPTRQKSQDFGLNRNLSEDLSILMMLNRQRSMSGNFFFNPKLLVDPVSAPLPSSIESEKIAAAAPPCPPHNDEEAQEASIAREESSPPSGDDSVRTPQPPLRQSARTSGKPKRKIVDSDSESDEEYTPSRKSTAKKAKKSSSSKSTKRSGYAQNNRGAHVRGRPEMQETARNGQRHWASKVQDLRQRWLDANCAHANAAFQGQLDLMARRHIKNQHECLLRSLHIAVAEGMIVPHAFNNAEGKSFLGWTGFYIVPDMASEFRAKIESMFPQPLLENTLHNTFRRAGLVPYNWSEAWLGLAPFQYKKPV